LAEELVGTEKMMKQDMETTVALIGVTSSLKASTADTAWAPTQAYHEMADIPVREIDLLEAVEANVAHLEELQARLRFMVREVKYLMKV